MIKIGGGSIASTAEPVSRRFDIAAAVNDHKVLEFCLNRSPDIRSGEVRLRTYEGFRTAGSAYNRALADSSAEYLVLVHQDIYLPQHFLSHLAEQVETLNRADPNWAVAGAIGMDTEGVVQGQTWSSGLRQLVGRKVEAPVAIETLDEILLVVRRAAGLEFDPDIPSFHLYGTDIVQLAKASGLKSYVIDAPVIHHSRPTVDLRGGYRIAYRYVQRKWRGSLPIPNLVCPISRTMIPFWMLNIRLLIQARGNTERREPDGDPVDIARRLGIESTS